MNPAVLARKQRGFGMLEAALSMALAGLFVIGIWALTRTTQQQDTAVHNNALLVRGDLALVSWAFQHGRLPCPATDAAGTAQQSCAAGAAGRLPYRDLGLPDAEAGTIQYTVQAYPRAGTTGINMTVDNSSQLQLLVGQSDLQPTPQMVGPGDARINVAAPYVALCSILGAAVSGTPAPVPAYTLTLQQQSAAHGVTGMTQAADSSRVLNRSFAELSSALGCPGQAAVSARALFHDWLSAQVLLAGLNGYQQLLVVGVQGASADLENGATPVAASGPAKVGGKVMNLLIEQGKCAEGSASDCGEIPFAVTDLTVESLYEAANGVKMVRFGLNEANASNFDYLLSQQIMATLAVQAAQMQQYAVQSLADGVYL